MPSSTIQGIMEAPLLLREDGKLFNWPDCVQEQFIGGRTASIVDPC